MSENTMYAYSDGWHDREPSQKYYDELFPAMVEARNDARHGFGDGGDIYEMEVIELEGEGSYSIEFASAEKVCSGTEAWYQINAMEKGYWLGKGPWY